MCVRARSPRFQKTQSPGPIVGAVHVVFGCTTCRPDICFAIGILCRCLDNPSARHIEAMWIYFHTLLTRRNMGLSTILNYILPSARIYKLFMRTFNMNGIDIYLFIVAVHVESGSARATSRRRFYARAYEHEARGPDVRCFVVWVWSGL